MPTQVKSSQVNFYLNTDSTKKVMKTTLPLNVQTSPKERESTRNTDVPIASFNGSRKRRKKHYLFHHKDCKCMLTQSKEILISFGNSGAYMYQE